MPRELLDRLIALVGLTLLFPLLALVSVLVWLQDFRSPLYVSPRATIGGRVFHIIKIRSMVVGADKIGSNSTTASDARITVIGRFVRKWKIDELSQLWNVIKGDMRLVGPRPQVLSEIATYTDEERRLLSVKPGITDFSSIVFADEGEILRGSKDPYLEYRRLIRPWKSRLGLFYVDHRSLSVDLQLISLTMLRIVAVRSALAGVANLLEQLGACPQLVGIARRTAPLRPASVPGRNEPFQS